VLAELKILGDDAGSLAWLPGVLLALGVAAAAGLAFLPRRAAALAAAIGVLLIAPAAWSAQTLGHAANGTFPAGGPQTAGMGCGGPGGGGAPGGGGMSGGDRSSLTEALAYTRAHGGGTIAVSSQSGAGSQVVDGAEVAAIGGFSGNESEVSAAWLADAVRAGKVRWVLTATDGRGGFSDGRTGSRSVMAAVENSCNPVDQLSGLYDCEGAESALTEAGG
jgi:hypothetical protein